MLLKSIISAFKMEEDTKESKNRYPHGSSSNEGTVIVGLKILAQISQCRSNVVVKPALVSTRSASRRRSSASGDQYYCYLKSCYLCNKNLSLDKEVYMYRGDQGFCSIECRDRQIFLDEMKELEASRKQFLKSNNRHCNIGADSRHHRGETRVFLEELR
ncbi:hypothetical protein AB3S75_003809 [Citrus x aurantiifolia]